MIKQVKRAVAISTYNRGKHIGEVVDGVLATVPPNTDVFVCDDGSEDDTGEVIRAQFPQVGYYRGPNKGVGANKNRCLYLMQNHHFMCILEDDLVPVEKDWFEAYETASVVTDIHHFCRIEDKEIPETHPTFSRYLKNAFNLTPIYASSPRGDLTFLTKKVITTIGGFHPDFQGVGYAHGNWSMRAVKAGLVSHSLGYVDLVEARDKFKQVGDTEGGRWDRPKEEIDAQIARNKRVAKTLRMKGELFYPLELQ
jgi:glycosyltransferase involved in cell wall biosynthesis